MTTHASDIAQNMKQETVESLQELVRGLKDSIQYHVEAADKIDKAPDVSKTLRAIAAERREICDDISSTIAMTDEIPAEEGTFGGSMRKIWTSFRAGLNGGDATVVLIEAERAEDVIKNKFETILPEIAGNPVSPQLNKHYEKVKKGHDRVLELRNAYQAK